MINFLYFIAIIFVVVAGILSGGIFFIVGFIVLALWNCVAGVISRASEVIDIEKKRK